MEVSMPNGVHLVGSVPLSDAEAVFRAVSTELGPWLKRVPDGETGARTNWIRWQREMLNQHPAMEVDPTIPPQEFRLWDGRLFRTMEMLRFRPGTDLDNVRFHTGYAEAAIDSYATFRRLRSDGLIPPRLRFQVCLPTPMATGYMDIGHHSRADFLAVYERALLAAVSDMIQAIPGGDLSIQWDVCQEVVLFEGYFADRPANYKQQVFEELARLGNAIPTDVECGYHLCYGSPRDEHVVMPKDMAVLREITQAIVDGLTRPLNFLHLPVPQARSDDAYFSPMRDFSLPPETDLYLGVIAENDGEGDRARVAAAREVMPRFGVATECGWGRKGPERVPGLIAAHKAAVRA
jgi:hypothetical protein